ncbi:MAG: hypothetical protein SV375_12830 [Thermodesulfobacteriota bacterium]|nr:hypothetical protein [Thermodesulfobacteriota bacterium]
MKTQVTISLYMSIFFIIGVSCVNAEESKKDSTMDDIFWMEAWSDNSYRDTNFGLENPFWDRDYKEKDFIISMLTVKVGGRLPLYKNIYLDPYMKFELIGDWGNDMWNDVYWNNNFKWGPGARLRYEFKSSEQGTGSWFKNLNLDIFSEYLTMEDSIDSSKNVIPDRVPNNNFRAGSSIWLSIDSRNTISDLVSFWGEMWGELAYESTNFYEAEKEDFYILALQPKLGLKFRLSNIVSLQPYFCADFKMDFADEKWNKKPWLNHIQYGPGIRLGFGNIKFLKNANIYLYWEDLSIDYLSRVSEDEYKYLASSDTRIGIEFWFPFGATKESVYRH